MKSVTTTIRNPISNAVIAAIALASTLLQTASADQWPRFRGPAAGGVAQSPQGVPAQWSATENVAWKTELPGPGASSPIIIDDRVYVTSYSGYGLDREAPGDIKNLKRNLTCIDLRSGDVIWSKAVAAELPEDLYDQSGVSSHGYASHTPISDGQRIYCFFGKSGVHTFDLNGNKLWNAKVGKGSDPPRWGSSSSPVLHNQTLIVTASAESQSIFGFNAATGKQEWQFKSKELDGTWATPTLVPVTSDRTDVALLVANQIWGLDPNNGKRLWRSEPIGSSQAYTCVLASGNRLFASTGQGGGTVAIDLDNPTASTKSFAWTSSVNATYASPLFHNDRVYVVSRGVLSVLDSESGERIEQLRLRGARRMGNDRFGSLDYASPVIADDRLFFQCASGQMFVFDISSERTKLIGVNEVTEDDEVFWGTPAVANGRMILRGSKHLYCIADPKRQLGTED